MKYAIVLILMCLTACSGPTVAFMGAQGTSIDVNGSTYTIYRKDNRIESVRTGPDWRPNLISVAADSIYAIESVTGCKVADGTFDGDAAVQRARVRC